MTVFYHPMYSDKDHQLLHLDLDNPKKWQDNWLMSFNPNECTVLKMMIVWYI